MGIAPLFGRHTKQRHIQNIGFVGIDQRNLLVRQLRRNQSFLDSVRVDAIMMYCGLSLSLIFAMSVKLRKSSRLRAHCTLISVPRTTSLSISIALPCNQFIQQPLTPFQHIQPSRFEVFGVPRVGNIAGVVGIVHQEM